MVKNKVLSPLAGRPGACEKQSWIVPFLAAHSEAIDRQMGVFSDGLY
jgi:hypothetical protein